MCPSKYPSVMLLVSVLSYFYFFFFDTREPLQVIIPPGFSVPNKVSPKPAGLQILTSKTATSLLITNGTDALSTINI